MAYETVKLQQLLREIAGRTASQHDADAMNLAADTLDSLAVDAAIARGITNVMPLPEPSGTSGGSGVFRVTGFFHWSCQTEKGHQRISLEVDMELPFSPFVGLLIQIGDDIPWPKIKGVEWRHDEQSFSIYATKRLKDYSSKLFESLLDDIRRLGPEYRPILFDDNCSYGQ